MILNIATDIYLLSIPLPLLWTVNISLKRKIPLMALFSGAAFVITASIIRGVTIMSVSSPMKRGFAFEDTLSDKGRTVGPEWCGIGVSMGLPRNIRFNYCF